MTAAPDPSPPATDEDDVSLITSVAGGDRKALERLYDRFAPILLGVGLKVLGGSRAEAEDLLHDVFFEIWQHAGDYDTTRGSLRTWMTLRMRSRAFDRLKSAGRSRTSSLDDGSAILDKRASTDPHVAPDHRSDHHKVRRTLATLPPDQRAVLEMQMFEDLSCSEIAGRLGIPIGTVKSRLAGGLRKMKSALLPARPEQPERIGS